MGDLGNRVFDEIFKPKEPPRVPMKWTPAPQPTRVDQSLQKVEANPEVDMQKQAEKALGTNQLTIPLVKPNLNTP